MRTFSILFVAIFAAVLLISCDNGNNPTGTSVVVNGVKWATCNVDAPGTFAASPESSGMLYQWNRKIGWSTTDPLVNSNGGTVWDETIPEGTVWTATNDPCPAGWRVPTIEELQTLLNTTKVVQEWTTQNGVIGRKFTDCISNNSIFLPAAGSRNYNDGVLSSIVGSNYWSCSHYGESQAHWLVSNNIGAAAGNHGMHRSYGYSVRCVVK